MSHLETTHLFRGTHLAIYSNMETDLANLQHFANVFTPFAMAIFTVCLYVRVVVMPARELAREKRLRRMALASDFLAKQAMYQQIGHTEKSKRYRDRAIQQLAQIELS